MTRGKSYGRDRRYYAKRNDWGSCLLTRVSGVYRQRIRGGSPYSSLHTVTNAQPKVCGNKYNGRHKRGMLFDGIRGLEWKEGNCGAVMCRYISYLNYRSISPAPLEQAKI